MTSNAPRTFATMHDAYTISPAARRELYPYLAECASLAPPEIEQELQNFANAIRSSLQHDGVFVD
jgi:hypothetical protein